MKLSRALSDLVKYTRSVGLYDVEAQGELEPRPRRFLTDAAAGHRPLFFGSSGLQLAGLIAERDQSPPGDAAESCVLHPLQPTPAVPHLPLLVPRGLLQLQPAAFLERRLPAG